MKKLPKNAFEPLDKYEAELIKAIENDEFVEVPHQKEEIEKIVAAANYMTVKTKKDKRITIRVATDDLTSIQNKAIESGIPYQTLITSVISKFAKGKISIGI